MSGGPMSLQRTIASAETGHVRSVITRLVTMHMARDVVYRALIRSVDDMDDAIGLSVGEVPMKKIMANENAESQALRSICSDLSADKEIAGALGRLLPRKGDTLVEPPTESILHAAAILVLWPYIEVGFADLDRRNGLWVAVREEGIPDSMLRGLRYPSFD